MTAAQQSASDYFSRAEVLENFIVFEGIDGAGKSTQIELLGNFFEQINLPYWQTEEPTRGIIGQRIRQQLQQHGNTDEQQLADLFAVDRAEHLYRDGGYQGRMGIIELCQQGYCCLCHRYHFSSAAYQGQILSQESIWKRNQFFPLPSWVIFLHLPSEEIEKRLMARHQCELYEKKDILVQAQLAYQRVFSLLPANKVNMLNIDAAQSVEQIHQQIKTAILPTLTKLLNTDKTGLAPCDY